MSINKIIAIDGPAGSGKSSTAKGIATSLGFKFFDTGAMYRSVTYYCMQHEVPLDDAVCVFLAVKQFADEFPLELSFDPNSQTHKLLGEDISKIIRSKEVTENIHFVSTNLEAREIIVNIQKQIIKEFSNNGIVVEGRDATDVLCKDAVVKVLLTADETVRAKRRNKEIVTKTGDDNNVDNILESLKLRDQKDSTVNNFTTDKEGVLTIDNTDLSLEGTINKIVQLFKESQ